MVMKHPDGEGPEAIVIQRENISSPTHDP